MTAIQKLMLIGFINLIMSSTVHADCKRSYVCDDYGSNCKYMDICGDSLDLPSIESDPRPSLPTLDLKPLPSLNLPPLGTSQCEYKQVNGQWENVCW
jgi:hypothetical protein